MAFSFAMNMADIPTTGDINSSETFAVFTLNANVPRVEVSGFTVITDTTITDGADADISDAVAIDITGNTVTLESNVTIPNVLLKVIGY